MFEYGHHGAGGRDTEYEGVDECDEWGSLEESGEVDC
jgi:hypothetical protein